MTSPNSAGCFRTSQCFRRSRRPWRNPRRFRRRKSSRSRRSSSSPDPSRSRRKLRMDPFRHRFLQRLARRLKSCPRRRRQPRSRHRSIRYPNRRKTRPTSRSDRRLRSSVEPSSAPFPRPTRRGYRHSSSPSPAARFPSRSIPRFPPLSPRHFETPIDRKTYPPMSRAMSGPKPAELDSTRTARQSPGSSGRRWLGRRHCRSWRRRRRTSSSARGRAASPGRPSHSDRDPRPCSE